MWITYLFLSGLFQWIFENIHPLVSAPAALMAVLFWRKARETAAKDMEIRRLQASLLNTTVVVEYVNSWEVCPECLAKRKPSPE
jgi:hypothetical protein